MKVLSNFAILMFCVGSLRVLTGADKCLNRTSDGNMLFLEYPNGSMQPVRIPYSDRVSAKINAHISSILLSEIMGYSTVFVNVSNNRSNTNAIAYLAGCLQLQ